MSDIESFEVMYYAVNSLRGGNNDARNQCQLQSNTNFTERSHKNTPKKER